MALPIMRSFQLDVARAGAQGVMYAREGDSQCYGLLVTLVEHSTPVSLGDGYTVYLQGKKPDGTNLQYKALVEDGRVRAYFGSQAFTADGIMRCELMIMDENGATLYAPRFDVVVEPDAMGSEDAESTSEFTALQEALTDMQELLQQIGEALVQTEIFHIRGQYETLAALKAAVTDPVPGSAYNVGEASPYDIYVYTGDVDQGDEGWLMVEPVHGTDGTNGYTPHATVNKTGAVTTIQITDVDGTTTAEVSDGTNGDNGDDGVTFTPAVSAGGIISFTNDGERENPTPVNLITPVVAALPAVRYDAAQSLTAPQKTQARDNIGALAAASIYNALDGSDPAVYGLLGLSAYQGYLLGRIVGAGMMVKSGIVSITTSGGTTNRGTAVVTFDEAYASAPVVVGAPNTGTPDSRMGSAASATATAVTLAAGVPSDTTARTVTVAWIAIGQRA